MSKQNLNTTEDKKHVIKVEEYTLPAFVFTIQKYVQEGYVVQDTNDGYPRNFVGLYECRMENNWPNLEVLKEEQNATESDNSETEAAPKQNKGGRPKRTT